mgnify:CR=1 FL=1
MNLDSRCQVRYHCYAFTQKCWKFFLWNERLFHNSFFTYFAVHIPKVAKLFSMERKSYIPVSKNENLRPCNFLKQKCQRTDMIEEMMPTFFLWNLLFYWTSNMKNKTLDAKLQTLKKDPFWHENWNWIWAIIFYYNWGWQLHECLSFFSIINQILCNNSLLTWLPSFYREATLHSVSTFPFLVMRNSCVKSFKAIRAERTTAIKSQ